MFDVDDLFGELERILVDLAKLASEGGLRSGETREFGLSDDLKVTSSFRIGFLDEMATPLPPPLEREPMIDVMTTKDGVKVLVSMPGVRKDDVKVVPRPGSLLFEISSRGKSYRKEIPCDLQPRSISVKSIVENNSVVEMTFARRGGGSR